MFSHFRPYHSDGVCEETCTEIISTAGNVGQLFFCFDAHCKSTWWQ